MYVETGTVPVHCLCISSSGIDDYLRHTQCIVQNESICTFSQDYFMNIEQTNPQTYMYMYTRTYTITCLTCVMWGIVEPSKEHLKVLFIKQVDYIID